MTAKTVKTRTPSKKPNATYDAGKGLAAINQNISLIRTNSNAFRQLVQDTLVMISRHAMVTGDCTAMARLMNDGLTNWHRRGPICDYIKDFTPILVVFKGGVATAKLEEKDQRKPFNIDGMVATPFWEHKSLAKDNELPLEIDDLDTTVTKLADRLAKKLKDGDIAPTAIEHAKRLIDGLKATVSRVREGDRETKPKPKPEIDEGEAAAAMIQANAA